MNALIPVILSIILALCIIVIIVASVQVILSNITIYFLTFNFREFPQLAQAVEDMLYRISKEQNIAVYCKTNHELNDNVPEDKKVLGKYIYLDKSNSELYKMYQIAIRDIMEINPNYTLEDKHIYPRILLVNKEEHLLGISGYLATFLHELGHHFAITQENLETEMDADRYAWKLVCENLPDYFQLIFYNSFIFRPTRLTAIEKLRLYFKFRKVKNGMKGLNFGSKL